MSSTAINDFVLDVATVNGSGSQSSNLILLKTLFRMGIPVSGKNFFPSNIQGLPTWYTIRLNPKGYTGYSREVHFKVAMNKATFAQDIQAVSEGGVFCYNEDLKQDTSLLRGDLTNIGISFRKIVDPLTKSAKLKKLLTNMAYVGVIAQLIKIEKEILLETTRDFFKDKPSVIDVNLAALEAGWSYAESELNTPFPYCVKKLSPPTNQILIDGNSAGALGLVFGGCTFAAWYPITPSSSLIENFAQYAEAYRPKSQGENAYAVVQAEDELSAISMVTGAGWAGARAITATSGPGMSLMAECAGLNYFAEIPAVIWNVQRVGPSTGLPTRTMQGDLLSAHTLSHGDTKHPVLLPGNPEECFEFGQTCFDLAERLQTLVIVLSDLDMGMNLSMTKKFSYPDKPFDRGQLISANDLEKMSGASHTDGSTETGFARYHDPKGDGLCPRTLPGTPHDDAAYFTRGTGHDEKSRYTEDPEVFAQTIARLQRKWETAKNLVPPPIIEKKSDAKVALIAYGSTDAMITELRDLLEEEGVPTSYLRLRALPLTTAVKDFLREHENTFIIEQNIEGQLGSLLKIEYPEMATKFKSLCHFDGRPIDAPSIHQKLREELSR